MELAPHPKINFYHFFEGDRARVSYFNYNKINNSNNNSYNPKNNYNNYKFSMSPNNAKFNANKNISEFPYLNNIMNINLRNFDKNEILGVGPDGNINDNFRFNDEE